MIERFWRFWFSSADQSEQASIVPRGGERGWALGVVIAIMSFLASLALGSVFLIANASGEWQGQIRQEATIQIVPVAGVDIEKSLEEAYQLVISFAGIAGAHILEIEETQQLLEPWLGHDRAFASLNLPRMILVRFEAGQQPDIEMIRARLAQEIEGAHFDDHEMWQGRLASMANYLVLSSIAIFILILVAMAVTAFFATRAILLMHAHIIEVLHFLGADPHFVARQFDGYFFKLGFKGALSGALIAIFTFWLLSLNLSTLSATAEGNQFALLFGTFSLKAGAVAAIMGLIVFIAFLVMLTSRSTVIRQLHEIDRYIVKDNIL